MRGAGQGRAECPSCGHVHASIVEVCSACGAAIDDAADPATASTDWRLAGDSLKRRWVAAVMAFWVSVLVLAAVSVIDGRLHLVLASISLGLLFIGVWLKARYQLHMRRGGGVDRH